jgi:hypothetical protein
MRKDWHFTHTWKTLGWPHHFSRRGDFGSVTEYLCHKLQRTCSTCRKHRSLSHSLPLIGFLSIVTQRVPLVEQELPIFPSSSTVLSGFRVTQSLDFSIIFCRSLFVILPFFLLAIVLSVLRITDSDNSFDIFKFFLRPPPYRNACTEPRRWLVISMC